MPTPARRLAFDFLLRSAPGEPHVADWLASPRPSALDRREGAFLRELLLGTLRRRGELDYALRSLSSRPLEALTLPALAGLRLGAYQILRMRVPPHAAVGETVDLVRSTEPRAASFINAVLRRLVREGPPSPPDADHRPLEWLASVGSLPGWLAGRWLSQLGPERAVARALAFLEIAPTCVRLNPRHDNGPALCETEGLVLSPSLVPGSFRVMEGNPRPLVERGIIHIQDAGSQAVAHLASGPGLVFDACAAPGGKTLLLADLHPATARVVAGELQSRRVPTLRRLVERWGAANVAIVRSDLERPPFGAVFDTVLVDAPCTGLATLSRNPDVRWRLTEPDIERHALRQARLLDAAAGLVRPGGRVVYSVCSLEPEETSLIVSSFLARHRAWRTGPLPRWTRDLGNATALQWTPERHAGDGFFAVVLSRMESGAL